MISRADPRPCWMPLCTRAPRVEGLSCSTTADSQKAIRAPNLDCDRHASSVSCPRGYSGLNMPQRMSDSRWASRFAEMNAGGFSSRIERRWSKSASAKRAIEFAEANATIGPPTNETPGSRRPASTRFRSQSGRGTQSESVNAIHVPLAARVAAFLAHETPGRGSDSTRTRGA